MQIRDIGRNDGLEIGLPMSQLAYLLGPTYLQGGWGLLPYAVADPEGGG